MKLEEKLVSTINGTVFVIEDQKEERTIGSFIFSLSLYCKDNKPLKSL